MRCVRTGEGLGQSGFRLDGGTDQKKDNEDEGDVRAGGCGWIDQELAAGKFHESLFRVSRRLTTSISSAAEASTWRTKLLMIPVK